jgi:hypothetical protein
MTDIEIHLHALPAELAPLFQRCVVDLGLYVAQVTFPPYEVSEVNSSKIDTLIADDPRCTSLVFSKTPFIALGNDQGAFAERNPNVLKLELGRLTPDALHESDLTARCDDANALAAWRRIVKEIKAITQAGVDVTNPSNGATGHDRNQRFTQGARELELRGVPIVTFNGMRFKLTGNG